MPFCLPTTLRLGDNLKMKSAHFCHLFNTFEWPPIALKQIFHMTWDALYDLIRQMWSLMMSCLSVFSEPWCRLFSSLFILSQGFTCILSIVVLPSKIPVCPSETRSHLPNWEKLEFPHMVILPCDVLSEHIQPLTWNSTYFGVITWHFLWSFFYYSLFLFLDYIFERQGFIFCFFLCFYSPLLPKF